jgi:hypothetical protein
LGELADARPACGSNGRRRSIAEAARDGGENVVAAVLTGLDDEQLEAVRRPGDLCGRFDAFADQGRSCDGAG